MTSFNTTGSGAATRAYQYDNAGQLTSNTVGSGPESYTYDDNGNRELVTNGQGTNQDYVPALANRLESDGTYTYQYDKEGNVTDRWVTVDPGQRTYYTWDHRNRLTKVSEWNGDHEVLIVDYKYDASGRLVSKATNRPFETGLETEYFVHDSNGNSGSELALSFSKVGTSAATLERRYLDGPAGQVLVDEVFNASGQSTDSLWFLGDHQGTPRDIVDDNGVLRKHSNFDSFGQVTGEQFYARNGSSITATHAEAVDQAFAYTGQFRDKDTGLQKHGQRWYDPGTGRWRSEDPLGFAGGDANFYRYVGSSPLIYVDPSGLSAVSPLANLNLNAGGYSGGKAAAAKPVSTAIASGFNALVSAGTAAISPYVSAIGGLATVATVGGFGYDVLSSAAGYTRGLKDSVDRTAASVYEGVTYAWNDPRGALTSVGSRLEQTKDTIGHYTVGWFFEYQRKSNLAEIGGAYDAAQQGGSI